MRSGLSVIVLWTVSSVGMAEVRDPHPGGFTSHHEAVVDVTPQAALRKFEQIQRWWDPAHSFSGKACALRLQLKPGGCFCERDGALWVRHLEVLRIEPGRRIVLAGALGPLQTLPVQAVLEVEAEVVEGRTRLRWHYRIGGAAPDSLKAYAAPVDGVMGHQFARWVAALSAD